MKKKLLLGCATILLLAGGAVAYVVYTLFFSMGNLPEGELLTHTTSPDETYTIHFYRTNGGATTDHSLRGELVHNATGETENIYWAYREQDVHAAWIDSHTVTINGRVLDVRKEKYDWRRVKKLEN